MKNSKKTAFDTGSSVVVKQCQVCEFPELSPVMFLGYLPPVNRMNLTGEMPHEQSGYPAHLLYCPNCHLVQLGLIVDAKVLFPPEYPYTSSTTKILRDNFAELYLECKDMVALKKEDLIVDIGSNDGNLLSNFKDYHRVLGITPEEIGKIAIERGIPTIIDYFNDRVVSKVISEKGKAKVITATNVFAHIENINEIANQIVRLLDDNGIFISESHYLFSLIETLQYDTVYHEHLRYYSLHSLKYLLEKHGLEIIHAKRIPTHGGSIRVYAAKTGKYPVRDSVTSILDMEGPVVTGKEHLLSFKAKVVLSKLRLHALLLNIKQQGHKVYGISAPSRASTLVNYVGLDDGIIDYILEVKGSHKIGYYLPGTLIPIVEESLLFEDQPEYALLLSWHISDELITNLRKKGYRGKFIIPLPAPEIVS
jgi:hypothetical protein